MFIVDTTAISTSGIDLLFSFVEESTTLEVTNASTLTETATVYSTSEVTQIVTETLLLSTSESSTHFEDSTTENEASTKQIDTTTESSFYSEQTSLPSEFATGMYIIR